VAALTHWRGLFPGAQPEHHVFPHEKYGLAGNDRQLCAYEIFQRNRCTVGKSDGRAPVRPRRSPAASTILGTRSSRDWPSLRLQTQRLWPLQGTSPAPRWHAIHTSAWKRRAVDDLSGKDFEPGVAQNWAQFFGVHPCSETDFLGTLTVSEKSDEANSLKTSGEPGRTRTSNPLIKRPSKDH
jgi:hypothetical protein